MQLKPHADCTASDREFFKRCYGRAWVEVERFYDLMEEHWFADRRIPTSSCDMRPPDDMWAVLAADGDRAKRMHAALDKAAKLVDKTNGAKMLARLSNAFNEAVPKKRPFLPKVRIPRVAEKPTLNGGIESNAWAKAVVMPPLPGLPKGMETTIKLLNGTNIYAANSAKAPK